MRVGVYDCTVIKVNIEYYNNNNNIGDRTFEGREVYNIIMMVTMIHIHSSWASLSTDSL